MWTEDGRREEVRAGRSGYALCYEIADLERTVAGDARAAGLIDYAADVMQIMTPPAPRVAWSIPEERA